MNKSLVRQRLLELELSKEEFAVKMGCSIATVYNMLAGRQISESNAYKAAKILGVDLGKLTGKRQPA